MKYQLFMMSLMSLFITVAFFLYVIYPKLGELSQYEIISAVMILLIGVDLGIFFTLTYSRKNYDNIKMYKRELEKESIAGDEASAQIKVLESKIEVLERALEQALNK